MEAEETDADLLVDVAKALIRGADKANIRLRAFGGIGVRAHCPHMEKNGLRRVYKKYELDLVALASQALQVDDFMIASGFQNTERLIQGYKGRGFQQYQLSSGDKIVYVDIFFGRLRFNHDVPWPYFEEKTGYTLPLSQLLLSKLAIVKLKEKDKIDIIALLAEHDIGEADDEETLPARVLMKFWCVGCAGWGMAKTCRSNIHDVGALLANLPGLTETIRKRVGQGLHTLEALMMRCPKSLCWKTRDVIGVKIAWYHMVEEDSPA